MPSLSILETEEAESPLAKLDQIQDDVLKRLDELNRQVLALLEQANQARAADVREES